MKSRISLFVLLVMLGCLGREARNADAAAAQLRWWKGNTHTHTLWSDGDAAPEQAAAWYKEGGYDFLVLSDHNILSVGERWFPVRDEERSRLTSARLEELRARFGAENITVREDESGGLEMRLKTLVELREDYEERDRFLFIQGEEITDSFEGRPVHVNGINLSSLIEPRGGESVRDVMNRNVDAVREHGRATQKPVLAHINHPNFGWGLSWEDVAHVAHDRFFEVYNGHRGVRNTGDAGHVSTEEMWDRALTLRWTQLDLGNLYGLATDDAHEYWEPNRTSVPGRGWVMVRAAELNADTIVAAMRRGDFYASSGVTLTDFKRAGNEYTVWIDAEEGLEYRTQFIGTRLSRDGDAIGILLAETGDNPAVYEFVGDELYVRAVVRSSRLHPRPFLEGEHEQAWTQPALRGYDF